MAVIGSRGLQISNLENYLPDAITEIISGGARGIDTCAKEYAAEHGIKYTEFLPEYSRYGKAAPLKRNLQIIAYADEVIAFWNGCSRGTEFVIRHCAKKNKKITVYRCDTVESNESSDL